VLTGPCARVLMLKRIDLNGVGRWHCVACGDQSSVTAGTIFHDTRTPLTTLFEAMWWVTNQKTDVSAVGRQRLLGLRIHKMAWTWLEKLRPRT
jgi:hypothetical protein